MAQRKRGRRPAAQNGRQSVDAAIKAICDIMRRGGRAGALQYVPELTWILFLRILDENEQREQEASAAVERDWSPALRAPFRWRDWAAPQAASARRCRPVRRAASLPL